MRFLAAALLASFILIYGCISVSPPQQCASLAPEGQPGCIYYSAVMEQSPYQCYSMQDKPQREICLKDSIDPSAKRALQRVPAGSAGAVLAGKIASASATAATQPAAQQPSEQPAAPSSPASENATTGGQNATTAPPLPQENASNLSS